MTEEKKQILDSDEMRLALKRIASEIIEQNRGTQNLVFIGIVTRGIYLAERLSQIIKALEGVKVPIGTLDITLYRDDMDLKAGIKRPMKRTRIPFDITGKNIILVDDVIYTGRTVRAALSEIMDYGRPKSIRLAVMIDRGHREFPIQPDYCGMELGVTRRRVKVKMQEIDDVDEVVFRDIIDEG